jgi:hypothetical protein
MCSVELKTVRRRVQREFHMLTKPFSIFNQNKSFALCTRAMSGCSVVLFTDDRSTNPPFYRDPANVLTPRTRTHLSNINITPEVNTFRRRTGHTVVRDRMNDGATLRLSAVARSAELEWIQWIRDAPISAVVKKNRSQYYTRVILTRWIWGR